jgi:hypothetical protein
MSTQTTADGWDETIENEIGATGAQLSSITDHWENESDLLDYLSSGNKPGDKSGIGNATSNSIYDWAKNHRPETYREFTHSNEAYCTEFIPRNEFEYDGDADGFVFGAICPRCGNITPMVGQPTGFAKMPYGCLSCRWASFYTEWALEAFEGEYYENSAGN